MGIFGLIGRFTAKVLAIGQAGLIRAKYTQTQQNTNLMTQKEVVKKFVAYPMYLTYLTKQPPKRCKTIGMVLFPFLPIWQWKLYPQSMA